MKRPEKINCGDYLNCVGCPVVDITQGNCREVYNKALAAVDDWLPDREELEEILTPGCDNEYINQIIDVLAERLGV